MTKLLKASMYPFVVFISLLFMAIDDDWTVISFEEWMESK